MKMSLSLIFLHGICFLTKGLCFFKKNQHKDKLIPEINTFSCRNAICEPMQYILNGVMKPHHFFLHNICLKGRIPLLKNYVVFVLLFDSYGRAYCIHAVMSLLQMILIYIHFYFRFFKIK